MGFKIASLQDLTFKHPVKIAGSEIECEFRVLDDDSLAKLAERGDTPFIQAVLKSWDGVEDDDGSPAPCGPAQIAALCRYAIARQAILKAYWQGLQQAAEGN